MKFVVVDIKNVLANNHPCKLISGSAFHNLDDVRSKNIETAIKSFILVITGQSRNINKF